MQVDPEESAAEEETAQPLSAEPSALARRRALELIGISFLALFLELAQIRFTNSTVQVMAYFNNFVILSAFLGLGLGVLLSDRWERPLLAFPFLWVGLIGSLLWLDAYAGVRYESSLLMAWVVERPQLSLPTWVVVCWVFFGTLTVFVPIGARLGQAIEGFENRLEAYGWDLVGSLLGVVGFGLVSWFGLTPVVWFSISAVLVALLLRPRRRWGRVAAMAALLIAVVCAVPISNGRWSPYYRVTVEPYRAVDAGGDETQLGYSVVVDKLRIQDALDLNSPALASSPLAPWLDYYALPHRLREGGRVLVLGGGSGNDTAAALKAGASAVTVVEIDSTLIELGHEVHPMLPYRDPRVTAVNADARAFLRDGSGSFDLIVMNALDSHLQLPGLSTLRLESFVYTVEAFRDVRRRMGPDTLFVLHHASARGWQAKRLYASLVEAFGQEPVLLTTKGSPFGSVAFVYGPASLTRTLPQGLAPVDPAPYRSAPGEIDLATDDWPHLYLVKPAVPELYQLVIVLIVGMTGLAFFGLGRLRVERTWLHFFLLGAAFMLLEANALTRFALLLGATWVVNAVVIAAILLMIWVGNALLWRGWRPSERFCYGGLALALLMVYICPLEPLLAFGPVARTALAGLWIGTPIFFASLVFSSSFREAANPSTAFGANLLGVVVGGTLEYLSMSVGMRVLILAALGLYAAAWVSARVARR